MLPAHVLTHHFFSANFSKDEAKFKLLEAKNEEGNFVFIPGTENDEIILLYKAFFRGQSEVREFVISFDDPSLTNSSLGTHTYLDSFVDKLNRFLDGWTSTPFVAKEASFIRENKPANQLNFTANIHKIILKKLVKIEEETNAQRVEQVKFIFETIKTKLPPAPEGKGSFRSRLEMDNASISKPSWYGQKIIFCRFDTSYNQTMIAINSANFTIRGVGSETFDNKYLPILVDICKNGTNPAVDEREENNEYLPLRP